MATSVRLNDDFVAEAKAHSEAESRTVPKQIEYWAKMGEILEENPDLSFSFVQEILLGKEQAKEEELTPYEFS